MDDRLVLGLDVGGTKCVALLGRADGMILERRQWASEATRGAEHMIERLRQEAMEMAGRAGGKLAAAGVAIGGPMDVREGLVLSPPNLPGWDRIPLKSMLEQWLGVASYVEHDAAACAMAEYLWGGWGRPEVLGYLTCGTGFGLGLVVNGRVFGGAGGRRPEVGHWRMADEGPYAFGKSGSAEAFCSGSGLSKLAAWMFWARWPDGIDGSELSRLAADGDADARAVIDENARYTGRVCAMLADLLTPNVITLGSLARYLGEPWLRSVRDEFAREAEAIAQAHCRIEPCALGPRIGDLSAIAAAVCHLDDAD